MFSWSHSWFFVGINYLVLLSYDWVLFNTHSSSQIITVIIIIFCEFTTKIVSSRRSNYLIFRSTFLLSIVQYSFSKWSRVWFNPNPIQSNQLINYLFKFCPNCLILFNSVFFSPWIIARFTQGPMFLEVRQQRQ